VNDDQEFVIFPDSQVAPIVAVDSGIIEYLASVSGPVGFSDFQFEMIVIAAAALPVAARDAFLQAVASRLPGQPSDAEVREAIDTAV
jgi:hypothetical protein